MNEGAVIPEHQEMTPEQAMELLNNWYQMKNKLRELRDSEAPLRRMLAGFFFKDPSEGTNRIDIGYGMDLVLTAKITRKVDPVLLDEQTKAMRLKKIKVDTLFEYVPQLVLSEYRNLTDEQRELVDSVLDIKDDGLPSLSIEPAKAREVAIPTAATPPAPPSEPESRVTMTEKADGLTLGDFVAQGWDVEQLVEHGYAVINETVPVLPPPPPSNVPPPPPGSDAPAKKRPGRPRGSKNKG